jgi:TRAP-type C4-dicarboxylate transport system substrate-binding protein
MRYCLCSILALFSACLLLSCLPKNTLRLSEPVSSLTVVPSDPIIFRLAEQAPENHPAAQTCKYFANLVDRESHGKIRIKVYFNGKLGNTREVFDQLKFGGIALGRVSFAELVEQVPSLQYDTKKIIKGPSSCRLWIKSNAGKIIFDCQTEKLYPLAILYSEMRCFYSYSSGYRIQRLQNLNGVRIGMIASSLVRNVLYRYGAVPVDIVSEDTYQSMHNGYMNVRESELSDFILSNDYRFCKYVSLSNYVSNPDIIVMSGEVMNNVTVEERSILMHCALQAEEFHQKSLQQFYDRYIPEMQKTKNLVRTVQ